MDVPLNSSYMVRGESFTCSLSVERLFDLHKLTLEERYFDKLVSETSKETAGSPVFETNSGIPVRLNQPETLARVGLEVLGTPKGQTVDSLRVRKLNFKTTTPAPKQVFQAIRAQRRTALPEQLPSNFPSACKRRAPCQAQSSVDEMLCAYRRHVFCVWATRIWAACFCGSLGSIGRRFSGEFPKFKT